MSKNPEMEWGEEDYREDGKALAIPPQEGKGGRGGINLRTSFHQVAI